MSLTRHDCGLVAGDQHSHAVQVRLDGPVALCGAGRIAHRLPGWFDPTGPLSCPTCVAKVTADLDRTS